MTRLILLFFFFWGSVFSSARAQTPDNLFDLSKNFDWRNPVSATRGHPLVFVDPLPSENVVQPIASLQPTSTPAETKVFFEPAFGGPDSADLVRHASNFNVIVQILTVHDMLVTQDITLIVEEETPFDRLLPLDQKANLTVTDFLINGEAVPFQTHAEPAGVRIRTAQPLKKGANRIRLSYVLTNALTVAQSLAHARVPITGPDFSYGVEHFSGIVLLPGETPVFDKRILFGANNLNIPELTAFETDEKGNTSFRMTRPLPAFAETRLILSFNADILPLDTPETVINRHLNLFFALAVAVFLALYAWADFYVTRRAPPKNLLITLCHASPLFWRYLTYPMDQVFFDRYKIYLRFQKKWAPVIFMFQLLFSKMPAIIGPLASFYAIAERVKTYGLTMMLLIGGSFWAASKGGFLWPRPVTAALIAEALLLLVLIYKKLIKPKEKADILLFRKIFLNKDMGFGLNNTAFRKLMILFYPFTIAMRMRGHWITKTFNNGIFVRELMSEKPEGETK